MPRLKKGDVVMIPAVITESNGENKILVHGAVPKNGENLSVSFVVRKIEGSERASIIEPHLRRKCKRYRKHVKGLQRGIKWRDELIVELAQRLGYADETITLSSADFKKLMEDVL